MDLYSVCILTSSLSFFAYTGYYFISSKMKNEFKRFGLEKFGLLIMVFQFLGAAGLIAGLQFNSILMYSSFGLALLMFFGLIVRIKQKDRIWVSLPALFYMSLNAYIFLGSIA